MNQPEPKHFQCRHIFTDGRRCGSHALRNEPFCYYHHNTRKPIASPKERKARLGTFELPLLEDRSAIQAALGEIMQRIASNDLDPRRAGLLLYALQIATLNLPKERTDENEDYVVLPTVEEVIYHPELGALAPEAEAPPAAKSDRIRLLEWRESTIDEREARLAEREYYLNATQPEPPIPPLVIPPSPYGPKGAQTATIPDIKATAQTANLENCHSERKRRIPVCLRRMHGEPRGLHTPRTPSSSRSD